MRGFVPLLYQREPAQRQEGEAGHLRTVQGGHEDFAGGLREGLQGEQQREGAAHNLHTGKLGGQHRHQPREGLAGGSQGGGARHLPGE